MGVGDTGRAVRRGLGVGMGSWGGSWGRGWGREVGFGVYKSFVGMVRGWGPVSLQLRLMGQGKSQRLPFITTSAHPMFFGGAVWWSL